MAGVTQATCQTIEKEVITTCFLEYVIKSNPMSQSHDMWMSEIQYCGLVNSVHPQYYPKSFSCGIRSTVFNNIRVVTCRTKLPE